MQTLSAGAPPAVVTYAPGDWVAAAGPDCWLLADAPASDPAVVGFVALMAAGIEQAGLLAALAGSGLVGLDSFAVAVVVAGEPGLALARGAAHVEIVDEGGDVWTVDAEGAATWVEARLPESALTVTLATGPGALADAASSDRQQIGGEPVGADLLVVDRSAQPEPEPQPESEPHPEVEPDGDAPAIQGDAGELAAWADSAVDEVVEVSESGVASGDAEASGGAEASGDAEVREVGEFGEAGVFVEPPRPSALPPRPPPPPAALPPTAPPPVSSSPSSSAAPPAGVPARPAAPPPATYAPDPEGDPTPTDRLRLGGRREGREDRVPVPPTGRPDPAELLPTVLCPLGHAHPPDVTTCPRCGSQVAAQQSTPLPRPPMGVLELASGETVAVDRGVLIGRTPSWPGAPEDRPHLVQLSSALGDISRNHLEVTLRGWDVVATDLGSMNGTSVTAADGGRRELTAGEAVVLADGDVLTIAEGVTVRYRRES